MPTIARVDNYLRGGKDNYAADRELARQLLAVAPELPRLARARRAFLRRAVQYCAEQGIDQFLDLDPGLPAPGAVHEVAQAVDPQVRVVYVGDDPQVRAHALALLCDGERTTFVETDLRDPDAVVSTLRVRGLLDLDRPVAVLFGARLQSVADGDDPHGVVRTVMQAMAPGSALVLAHDAGTPRNQAVARLYGQELIANVPRERAEVERFFTEAPLVEPGLVDVRAWRPGVVPPGRRSVVVFGGVGRKQGAAR